MDFTRQSTSHWLLYICFLLLQEWGLEGYQLWLVCSQTQDDDNGLYETINQPLVTVYMFSIATGMGFRGVPAWLVVHRHNHGQSTTGYCIYVHYYYRNGVKRGTSYGLYVHRHKRMIMDFTRQSTSHWLLYICSLLLQE